MTEEIEQIRIAARKVKKALGAVRIPVIPLFEEIASLRDSERVVRGMLSDREIGRAIHECWGGYLEVMVGYSDSAKESGVLMSRLTISKTLPRLEKTCLKEGVSPLFFHGSGGSVDRGGGTVEDQTAWWPRAALKMYKVTIQGEMVERSLASPEIVRGQIERIAESARRTASHPVARTEESRLIRIRRACLRTLSGEDPRPGISGADRAGHSLSISEPAEDRFAPGQAEPGPDCRRASGDPLGAMLDPDPGIVSHLVGSGSGVARQLRGAAARAQAGVSRGAGFLLLYQSAGIHPGQGGASSLEDLSRE